MARPPNFSRNSSAASLLREDFMRYVSKHRRLGQNFPGQQSYYVSPRAQQEWWKRSRVKELFDSFPKLDVTNQELVRLEYLGVLSTLVHIGRGEMIRDFVLCGMHDRKFPFYSPPPNFPTGDLFTECFDEFAKRQWMFFPLIIPCRIPHEEALLDQHIIPINRKESIEERSGAQIFKIQLDPECNGQDHLHHTSPPPQTYILKTYKKDDFSEYEAESKAFGALANNVHIDTPPPFLKCHGQYEQGETYNLVLEYMDGGSLEALIGKSRQPLSVSDIVHIWESVCGVLANLWHFSAVRDNSPADLGDPYVIIHRDVKPGNILLSHTDPNNPYQFRSVLADLGKCSVQRVPTGAEARHKSTTGGDQMYCAPEVCPRHRDFNKIATTASPASDIFSLGGVFSVLATWTILGPRGVSDYFKQRDAEHQRLWGFQGSGFEGCFHGGGKPLDAVHAMHNVVRERAQAHDPITSQVLQLVEHQMLRAKPDERSIARVLYEHLGNIVHEAKERLGPGEPSIPNSTTLTLTAPQRSMRSIQQTPANGLSQLLTQSGSSARAPFGLGPRNPYEAPSREDPKSPLRDVPFSRRTSTNERLTLKQVHEYRMWKKAGALSPFDYNVIRPVERLKRKLGRRDHIFFIDDTESMNHLRCEVETAFEDLSYIAKGMDDDGIEIAFASSAASPKPNKKPNTSPLNQLLTKHKYTQNADRMEGSLGDFIMKRVMPQLTGDPKPAGRWSFSGGRTSGRLQANPKEISIYVLTDGAWGRGGEGACGVDKPIKDLIQFLDDNGFPSGQVVFQFIRFGQDPDGERYLKYLDDFGLDCNEGGRDIVDTRHINGNVYSMFVGSTSKSVDQSSDEDNMSSEPASSSARTQGPQQALLQLNGQTSPSSGRNVNRSNR